MSDDKVRLWRYARHGARIPEWSDVRGYEGDDGVPYIARPVADDDAREERLREALNTNARLHRRCQKAEALPKWDDVGLARALVAMLGSLRHRYAMLRRDAAQTTARERDHIAHIVCVLREWIRDGRPTNHTAGKEADALVDDAIATARDRDEWKARAERAEAERDEARKALAGHLFDGESLSLREAIRSEMLKDYARAINAHDAATARATKAEAERDRTRECLDSVQRNYDGDTAYISKAVTEAGFTFCTTESQPEHAIEIVSAIEKLKAERDSARALLREARGCVSSAKINAMGYCDTEERLADLLARIDAESAERDQGAVGDQTGGGK